ncbi:PREDICTED: peroxisomal leader peptide-processing protease [Cyprinodon variegatus]|uniref:Peroxisomal leader peptide-processing protease n=1 Tax=Cyprinodon variegatus TaxID=28743 RepID=A0A3Q2D363_CYPVA|nr:PREDICTED: peroxisomal leader peptide-processing protease [Cyprinodon variegatus]
MELNDVEKCCCVVKISGTSERKPVSCSGVIVHFRSGTVICTGLPFSRFVTDRELLSSDTGVLFPRSFSDSLKIRVCFSDSVKNKPGRQREVSGELMMLVNCLEFKQAFLGVFQESDQWRFHGDDEDADMMRDAQSLSWFAVLKVRLVMLKGSDPGPIPWQSCSALQKGFPVVACGSPFGSLCLDLFSSTLSRGIISNLAGEDNAVILTDARCLPGTEGGGLFAVEATDGVRLIGLIVSPFGWKSNEWIGLTLVCSVDLIFRNIMHCTGVQDGLCLQPLEAGLSMSSTAQVKEACRYPTVCFVDSGQVWGSGVVITTNLVVTCRHVVSGKSLVTLKFHQGNRVCDVIGDVLFSTKASSPYDLAFIELRVPVPDAVIPKMSESFRLGDAVVIVGYGGLGRFCGPSLTSGVLSKVIPLKNQPVMFQTTCAVQAGSSGGAVVQKHSGELLGIVSSNARDLAASVTYPHLNFIIPVPVFQKLLQEFHQMRNVNVFNVLNSVENDVKRVWRLQAAQSKL